MATTSCPVARFMSSYPQHVQTHHSFSNPVICFAASAAKPHEQQPSPTNATYPANQPAANNAPPNNFLPSWAVLFFGGTLRPNQLHTTSFFMIIQLILFYHTIFSRSLLPPFV